MGVNFDITNSGQDVVTVGEKLWLTSDRERVVKDGDPDAAFLLCAAGNELPRSVIEQYGLNAQEASTGDEPEPDGDEQPETGSE